MSRAESDATSRIDLPSVPADQAGTAVAAWRAPLTIDTYEPVPPTAYPAFLETRVYQGSSGRVYPLPFHERISPTKAPRAWDAIHLENPWIRLVVLPELGGRIHIGYDKTRGYDFFYRNNVIKPALVGLAGPWISGGIEFNWPQHHRPGTYLPTDAHIERHEDGSVTVWCSDHDPFARMKGMHGITLHPDRAVVEVKVRAYNRTDQTQTFLWWSNVAARVDEHYQSFFPSDVHWVADHAKRATVTFPRATGKYYGWDYPAQVDAEHPDADRLDWYKNIPVPTSYMCVDSAGDFFGGYDHAAQAGFVHWADHHISPGKKQWTWGNSPFGWAWDRNLTDGDGAYVELMAGVYTDNQPDFSFLLPGETKTWSQYWYPIQDIGPAHQATLDAAVRLDLTPADGRTTARAALATTADRAAVTLRLTTPDGRVLWQDTAPTGPGAPLVREVTVDGEHTDLVLTAVDGDVELVRWQPAPVTEEVTAPAPEPVHPAPWPHEIASVEELYLTGAHLEQYRHPTRSAEPYWLEALHRDPGHSRSHVALGAALARRAEYTEAAEHLQAAVDRLTALNPNPADGEPYYLLGQVLRRLGRDEEAYAALAKATWNAAWRAPAGFALAQIDHAAQQYDDALARLDAVLAVEGGHLRARDLRVLVLRRLGRTAEAQAQLADTLALDALDWWAADLAGRELTCDAQTCLDIALDYRAVGEWAAALRLVEQAVRRHAAHPDPGQPNPAPIAAYYRADLLRRRGREDEAAAAVRAARTVDGHGALVNHLDDIDLLTAVTEADPSDARAHALLGHWLYFQRRYDDALARWRCAVELDPSDAVSWRNLGVAGYNIERDPDASRAAYDRALAVAPQDAKLVHESDQLDRRRAVPPVDRLRVLDLAVVAARDDLTTEHARLLVLTGDPQAAVDTLAARDFQPWEGGEGQVLGAWDQAHHALALRALAVGDPVAAVAEITAALEPPLTLGEGRHPLANCAHLWLTLGDAHAATGDQDEARRWWTRAAAFDGDFEEMATRPYSPMTAYSVLAWRRLGEDGEAKALVDGLREYVDELAASTPSIDYFATSLPTMLLFHEDLQTRQDTEVLLLRAQLAHLEGDEAAARDLAGQVEQRDPALVPAALWAAQVG